MYRTVCRSVAALALLAMFAIPGCQCSDKPDIGPVEDEEAQVIEPASEATVAPLFV